jgi:hypothetical protein
MAIVIAALLPALGVLVGMLVSLEIGRRIGAWLRARQGDLVETPAAAIDGAIFALFGLLIAFTFSGAAGRFDHRRDQIADEANSIGTAWMRIDLLPPEAQPPVRGLFRDYVRSRIATYRTISVDEKAAEAEYGRSQNLQNEIWAGAVPAARSTGNGPVLSLVVQSLNDMFDMATARVHASRTHVPAPILGLLFVLALASALVVGYASAKDAQRNWFHTSLFAVVIAASIFIILDLEHPRIGFIRLDDADRLMDELLAGMK